MYDIHSILMKISILHIRTFCISEHPPVPWCSDMRGSTVKALGKIIPWMFAMDNIHYARWLTVHVIDLLQLQSQCPDIYKEFIGGRFVT